MSERDSRPGFNPKHRIVGAVILVAIAVITLPLILNKREPPAHGAKPGEDTKTVIANVPPLAANVPAPAPAPADTEIPSEISVTQPPTPAPLEKSVPDRSGSDNAAPTAPAKRTDGKTANADAASGAAASRKEPGWYVQVGTFSNPDNARALMDKLKRKGYPANLETVRVEQTSVTRVRVGPYGKDSKAKAVKADLQRSFGIRGIVRHY